VAPEVLADNGYDGRAADVWSCGVILYVLMAGFLPFDEPTMSTLFRKIQKAEFSYPSWFSEGTRALLDRILTADPSARASLAEIVTDPWMQGEGGDAPSAKAVMLEATEEAGDVAGAVEGGDDDGVDEAAAGVAGVSVE
jgi:5'-AMP-activated protein kinase catalytic alpha subunit